MKLRRARFDEPEVNIAPLIDVVFLLLIFFMVTATFVHEQRIDVSLPVAESGHAIKHHDRVQVTIDAAGRYAVDGRPAGAGTAALERALAAAAGGHAQTPRLLIRADGRATHQAVVTVMDAAARLGFGHISMAAMPAANGLRP